MLVEEEVGLLLIEEVVVVVVTSMLPGATSDKKSEVKYLRSSDRRPLLSTYPLPHPDVGYRLD